MQDRTFLQVFLGFMGVIFIGFITAAVSLRSALLSKQQPSHRNQIVALAYTIIVASILGLIVTGVALCVSIIPNPRKSWITPLLSIIVVASCADVALIFPLLKEYPQRHSLDERCGQGFFLLSKVLLNETSKQEQEIYSSQCFWYFRAI